MQNILLLLGCGYNCHRKCMEKVPNTCGINQKLMKDILEDIKANKDVRIINLKNKKLSNFYIFIY